MKRRAFGILLMASGLALLSACAGTPERAAEGAGAAGAAGEAPAATGAAQGGEAQAAGAQTGGAFQGSPLEDPASPLSKRVFYFPFDSSEVSEQDREILAAHARYMAANPNVSVVVEGHADERGSREYNLALGERRAKSVERLLLLQGPGKEQLQMISFGEERPVAPGHDESAWGLNRRVELLYSGY